MMMIMMMMMTMIMMIIIMMKMAMTVHPKSHRAQYSVAMTIFCKAFYQDSLKNNRNFARHHYPSVD